MENSGNVREEDVTENSEERDFANHPPSLYPSLPPLDLSSSDPTQLNQNTNSIYPSLSQFEQSYILSENVPVAPVRRGRNRRIADRIAQLDSRSSTRALTDQMNASIPRNEANASENVNDSTIEQLAQLEQLIADGRISVVEPINQVSPLPAHSQSSAPALPRVSIAPFVHSPLPAHSPIPDLDREFSRSVGILRRDIRERARARRSEETVSQREARLSRERMQRAERTSRESEIDRSVRLLNRSDYQSQLREAEPRVETANRVAADSRRRALRNQCRAIALYQAAFTYNPEIDYENHPLLLIGDVSKVCQHCGARRFADETANLCCSEGRVSLTPIEQPPEPMLSLFSRDSTHPLSREFMKHILRYNNCFKMTSFGASGSSESMWSTFKIQGQIYHRIGSLMPVGDPKFLQVYFLGDAETQIDVRCDGSVDVNRQIVRYLQNVLDSNNALISLFKTALERMPTDQHSIVIRADRTPAGEHVRRYNAPTVDEIAIVIVEGEEYKRDIVIQRRNNSLRRINETHPSYDALQYPLIFWRGCDTFHFNIRLIDPATGLPARRKLTPMNYYAHQLMIRRDDQNYVLKCGALLNQFVVDMYCKIEAERLSYLRFNQKQLRAEKYVHLRDAMMNDGDASNLGEQVILPSTFIGSPRHMHEYAQDAMAYVRLYGRPDLFITFTCNSNWSEIKNNLFTGQSSSDRHDLVARVFQRKQIKLLDVINKNSLFGPTKCYMSAIEWQKRGLPHSHTLVWLENRIRPEQIDDIISAELPDPIEDPVLYDMVTSHLIHGPCGSLNMSCVCMDPVKKTCTKKFPRALLSETQTGADGYPLYRRRKPEEGGFTYTLRPNTRDSITLDNGWVVPHNRVLCRMFNSHINVEYCNSVKSIKYICKYINKGSDMAVLEVNSNRNDEIEQYRSGRYINSNEAFWRIFGFKIHHRHPTVTQLHVHLENGQRIYYTAQNLADRVENPPNTTLTAFFLLCQSDDFAKTLLYADVPTYYVWNESSKIFTRRKRGIRVGGSDGVFKGDAIGRIYSVHPSQQECFHLRLLLTKIRGPTSFAYLKQVDGYDCATFREACMRHGFLESDSQWKEALTEAAATSMPPQIRSLFSVIVSICSPSNPSDLWIEFRTYMSEDILNRRRRANPTAEIDFDDSIFNEALILIEDICLSMSGQPLSTLGLPTPVRAAIDTVNSEILRETSYDVVELERVVSNGIPLLNEDQHSAYISITDALESGRGGLFFLDAPGGTGKTFLLSLILADVRRRGNIILAVASSGIAATLLTGGRTAHSMFKLTLLPGMERGTCAISRGSAKGQLLHRCKAIIWDEATMSDKRALEAVDRTMRDIRHDQTPFGGAVVILAGDFRQTLPVIKRGTPADSINACIKNSHLWSSVVTLRLTTNMRVMLRGGNGAQEFTNKLLEIGNGTFPLDPQTSLVRFTPDFCTTVPTVEDLINRVFPDLHGNISSREWLSERAILAPLNDTAHSLNKKIQDQLTDRQTRFYFSVDKTLEPEQAVHYPIEFLNSITPSGFPLHSLELKVGSPIMLMRNLDPPKLCNGTRMSVKRLHNNLIEAIILAGQFAGEVVFIPRIPHHDSSLMFEFSRLQFPVRLAYAMTINKSQGQSLKVAGLQLEEPCFSHGQLYVACSRVGSPSGLYVLVPEAGTKNVVYEAALR